MCVRYSNNLRIFCDTGEDYKVALQFNVLRSWKSKFGLILERQVSEGEQPVPVIFCLLHPLDDVTRTVWKQGNKIGQLTDQVQQIVYTDDDSNLAITYNSQTDLHSVWRIRRASQEEAESVRLIPNTGSSTSANNTGTNTPLHSGQNSAPLTLTPSNSNIKIGCATPALVQTPAGSRTSRQPSGFSTPSSKLTPGATRGGSPVSRLNSPQSMGALLRSGVSPSFSSKVTARLGESAFRLRKLNLTGLEEEVGAASPLPVEVSLCFDHLWTEPLQMPRELSGRARKVFKSRDTVGQAYICLLLPTNQLSLVKVELANNESTTMIFGTIERIPAVDAVPIEELNMILILDPAGSLSLYNGACKIGKAILPPSSTALLSQEISALAIDSKPGTPFSAADSVFPVLSTPIQQRGANQSLVSRTKPPKGFGGDFAFLSPLSADLSGASIVGVRDPCGRTVTLVYSNGYMLRVTLPKVSTSLVEKSLEAVKQLLPRELARQLHGSWYTKRHAPGPTTAPAAEWDMFCKCLLGLSGYQVDHLDLSSTGEVSGCPGPKKSKTDVGTDGDWQYLLDSPQHTYSGHSISTILRLEHVIKEAHVCSSQAAESSGSGEINPSAQLFSYIPSLFWALHLLYEEMKLDTSLQGELPFLANLLSRLASDLRLVEYQHHYWMDYPENSLPISSSRMSQLTPELFARLSITSLIPMKPPCIYSHLQNIQLNRPIKPFPIIIPLNGSIKLVTSCLAALSVHGENQTINMEHFLKPLSQPGRPILHLRPVTVKDNRERTVAELIHTFGWDKIRIGNLPPSVVVPVLCALSACQRNPDPGWGSRILTLIGREDLAQNSNIEPRPEVRCTEEAADGLEGLDCEITSLRWPKDLRVVEVRRILQSSKPVVISTEQGPEVSDHDFLVEQEYFLKRMCERTMALPIGRGIAALRTMSPLPTEILKIPPLCLTGKATPRGTRVELKPEIYQNMDHWPSFHNGVAAGLRLSAPPDSQEVDSSWISFNKPPTAEANAETEHAGFLMALGLNGHLAKLGKLDAFEYLNKGCEAISIGLLIGVATSHFGTMDVLVTKKLATQLEALLPPTATELPLSHNTQVAALMGVGLLYANTGHRHMVEVCIKELGKPPGPELENCVDRESYSLTAGLALGVITMGQGEGLVVGSLADLNLPNVLHNHMLGGPRLKPNSSARERPQSYQIKEGDNINIDITSPGATLALGMMYWRTGNRSVASWLTAPDTIFLLDFVRPDFLLLRTLAKGLIMWNEIEPSIGWIESHVPASMLPHCLVRPPDCPVPGQENLDYETLNQAYCNIVSGAAFVLALKFAGTWDKSAFDTLEHMTKKFIAISKRSIAELTGKAVIEQTICLLVLSQGMVMAGSGDLSVLRTCRYLRSRVHTSTIVTYGSHMAVHMATGLLFMGGGRFGFARTPGAVAMMIIAFFPKFPTHSNDNRYHLQALRHLYVLAVEPRLILPRCSQTRQVVPCTLTLQHADGGQRIQVTSPILLPSLDLLTSITVEDKHFWRARFSREDGWQRVRNILENGGSLAVKRSGLAKGRGFQWSLDEDDRGRLEQDRECCRFMDTFLKDTPAQWRTEMESLVCSLVAKEQRELISVVVSLLALPNQLSLQRVGLVSPQLRSILSSRRMERRSLSLEPELLTSVLQRLNSLVDRACALSRGKLNNSLRNYVQGLNPGGLNHSDRQLLASVVCVNGIPVPRPLNPPTLRDNPLMMMEVLKHSPNPASLYRVLRQAQRTL